MKKTSLLLTFLVLVLSATLRLHAQSGVGADGPSGCDSSPENPTVILAALGSAGGFFVSLRARLKARRK